MKDINLVRRKILEAVSRRGLQRNLGKKTLSVDQALIELAKLDRVVMDESKLLLAIRDAFKIFKAGKGKFNSYEYTVAEIIATRFTPPEEKVNAEIEGLKTLIDMKREKIIELEGCLKRAHQVFGVESDKLKKLEGKGISEEKVLDIVIKTIATGEKYTKEELVYRLKKVVKEIVKAEREGRL